MEIADISGRRRRFTFIATEALPMSQKEPSSRSNKITSFLQNGDPSRPKYDGVENSFFEPLNLIHSEEFNVCWWFLPAVPKAI